MSQAAPGLPLSTDQESPARATESGAAVSWKVGVSIVTYWAGPRMTDAVARQMSEGGWNLVWCGENDLDVVARHGLRAQLQDRSSRQNRWTTRRGGQSWMRSSIACAGIPPFTPT